MLSSSYHLPTQRDRPRKGDMKHSSIYSCSEEHSLLSDEGVRQLSRPAMKTFGISSEMIQNSSFDFLRRGEQGPIAYAKTLRKTSVLASDVLTVPSNDTHTPEKVRISKQGQFSTCRAEQLQFELRAQMNEIIRRLHESLKYSQSVELTLASQREKWRKTEEWLNKVIQDRTHHVEGLVQLSTMLEQKLIFACSSSEVTETGSKLTRASTSDLEIQCVNLQPAKFLQRCKSKIKEKESISRNTAFQSIKESNVHLIKQTDTLEKVEIGVSTVHFGSEIQSVKLACDDSNVRSESNANLTGESIFEESNSEQALREQNEWLQKLNCEKDKAIDSLLFECGRLSEQLLLAEQTNTKKQQASTLKSKECELSSGLESLLRENEQLRMFRAGLFQVEYERDLYRQELNRLLRCSTQNDGSLPNSQLYQKLELYEQELVKLYSLNGVLSREINQLGIAGRNLSEQKANLENFLEQCCCELSQLRKQFSELEAADLRKHQQIDRLSSLLVEAQGSIAELVDRLHIQESPASGQDIPRSLSLRSVQKEDKELPRSNTSFELNLSDDAGSISQPDLTKRQTFPTEYSEGPEAVAQQIEARRLGSFKERFAHHSFSLTDEPLFDQDSFQSQLHFLVEKHLTSSHCEALKEAILSFLCWAGSFTDRSRFYQEAENLVRKVAESETGLIKRMNFMEDTLAVYLNQALILLDGDEESCWLPQ